MNPTTHTSSVLRVFTRGNITSVFETLFRPWRVVTVAAMLACGLASSAQAQSVRFNTTPLRVSRITLPPSYSGTYKFTNSVTVSSLGGVPVDFAVTGLPAGATVSITATNGDALPVDGGLPSSLITTNTLLTFTFSSVANGTYPLVLNGSNGATNQWPFVLQVGSVWFSPTNNVTGGSGSPGVWGTAASWSNNIAPGTSDDVIFDTTTAEAGNPQTNIVVNANTTVGSVRFSGNNNTTAFHTLLINPGFTLNITNANGFSMLRDYAPATGAKMTINIVGTNNSTLAVSNEAALFAVQAEGNTLFTLNMSLLDNLKVNVSRMPLGDYQAYPNFQYYVISNNYGDVIKQFAPAVSLARTNIIRTTYADPNNYTNGGTRSYGFCLGNNYGGGSGSSPNLILNFGVTNSIYADGVCFVHAGAQSTIIGFNSLFSANSPSALFRGTNGGRMSIMALSDFASFTNVASGSSPKSTANFIAGTIDVMVDRFYMSLDRFNSAGAGPQSTFNMGAGIFDCNTAILGYESYGNHTNTSNCQGTMLVSNGTFRVNNSLTLGYTTDAAGVGAPQNTFGKLTLWGGTNYINSVSVGGVTKLSTGNAITLTNGAMLVISNNLADSSKFLDFLNMATNSSLVLFLNATSTVPVVYATTYTINGSNNIVIAAIKNPGSLTNNQQIPLLKKGAGAFPAITLLNQSGVNGSIVTDPSDANQQDFQVILNAPKNLVWKGTASADWDNTTKNWQDTATGVTTNFLAGDTVTFNDTASQFNINLVSGAVILPGSILVTNVANSYTFNNSSGGSIIGSVTLTKKGSNSLTIDGPMSDSVALNSGTLTGSGSVGSVTVSSGAALDFSGSINGNVDSAGIARSSGTISGGVTVQSGGAVTNAGTLNGSFAVNSGGLLVNNPSANMGSIGSGAAVAAGGTFVNRSTVTGANLTIGGTLLDTGEGTITLTGTLTANSGSTIIPGGNGVGTTTIISGVAAGFPGRVLLAQGSTTIFKMDIVGGINTKLLSGYQDFGASSSVRSQNGCTLVITNVTGSFAAGQTFTMFQYYGGGSPSSTGTSTNTYPVISPAKPGPGLSWDLTQLWPSGVIGVVSTPVYSFTNSFSLLGGTNIVGQFSWDPSLLGYRLESEVEPITIGLLTAETNWSSVAGSWTNTAITLTNAINGTNSVFYRLVFP